MNWPEAPKLPCPECGMRYTRTWDGEYEIISCKKHGFQYPMRLDYVELPYQDAFRMYVDAQPNFTARANVYTPARWTHMAHEFMRTVPTDEAPWERY